MCERRAHAGRLRPWGAVLAWLLLSGCSTVGHPGPVALSSNTPLDMTASEAILQPESLVDLTVYFRSATGDAAHLVAVRREVPVGEDLVRRALELLLAGPRPQDGEGLAAPLPTTTTVRTLSVRGDTATVDLSAEVLTDAGTVGRTPDHEVLALAAIADTLTEFPTIERVRLQIMGRTQGVVAGHEVSAFWGAWGLPAELVRDESVIGAPATGDALPDPAAFGLHPQSIGSPAAGAVQVTSVRTRSRTTYLRLVLELAGADGADAPGDVPPASATATRDGIALQVTQVVGAEPGAIPDGAVPLADAAFEGIAVDTSKVPGMLSVTLAVPGDRPFRLHRLTSPNRIVLDVRKRA